MAETFFCPFIKMECKKDECIMWRENSCVIANFMFVHSKEKPVFADYTKDQVDEDVKTERLQQLIRLQNSRTKKESTRYLNETVKVLVDGPSRKNKEMLSGRTSTHKIVLFKGDKELIGKFVNIKINETKTWTLYGEIAE